jgi:hypothetical protein
MTEMSDPDAFTADQLHQQFKDLLRAALEGGDLVRLSLSKYHGKEPDLRRVLGRLVAVKGGTQLSLVYRYKTRDVTKNFPLAAGIAEIMQRMRSGFHHAHLTTSGEDVQLATNRRGDMRLQRGRLSGSPAAKTNDAAREEDANDQREAAAGGAAETNAPRPLPQESQELQESRDASLAHDRAKRRLLDIGRPFLAALGITTRRADGGVTLVPAMARKWKQVNKFLEILDHAIETAGLGERNELRVVDFGSGKGYLTFAVHDYLTHVRGMRARVTGVELRPDLVGLCNGVARDVGADGLDFEAGSIRDRMGEPSAAGGGKLPEPVDVLIALHACDTATDEAMSLGVHAGAAVILCSPCCHKELRPQMHSPLMLRPMFRHGIHLGQEAEMVTDSLRALLLEAEGYETQVFEFVSLEHTSKNKMILAVRDAAKPPATAARDAVLSQVGEIKSFYGIRAQRLEALLEAHPQPS